MDQKRNNNLIEVNGLKQYFKINDQLIIKAVDGVSLHIKPGEVVGLVGETGCGKSTMAKSIAGIYKPTEGEILFEGKHSEIQMIFQDSAAALNPRMTVEKLILEPLKIAGYPEGKMTAEKRMRELLQEVGLNEMQLQKYPSELSGGQRQRVAIARSLISTPKLIIADEPIASLDISIQAQIINLFKKLQKDYQFTFLFIAHDLSVVRYLSNRIGVMLHGKLVELAETEELFQNPVHPYTKALLSSIHLPDPDYERNHKVFEYDTKTELTGELKKVSDGHYVLI